MKALDRLLQRWRISKAGPYLGQGARVLDLGCADAALFRQFESRVGEVVGIDPTLERSVEIGRCRLVAGAFPDDLPDWRPFDAITMFAVLEHVPEAHQPRWAEACASLLKPGGYLVITVPNPIVDKILEGLKAMRLIDGMSLEEHYGFDPRRVPEVFSVGGMRLVTARRFQLGCNNLFVFQKAGS